MVLYTRILRTVNVNWNNDSWNVNANPIDNPNDWNANNQVFSRNFYFSLTDYVRVFASNPFFQPPTIFPSSCKCSDKIEYLFVSSSFVSQAIMRKNLSESSRRIPFDKVVILSCGF